MENVCRICLNDEDLTSIEDKLSVSDILAAPIAELIELISNIKVVPEDSRLSKFICYVCKNQLIESIKFREKIIATDIFLKNTLKDGEEAYDVIEEMGDETEIIEEFILETDEFQETAEILSEDDHIIIKSEESFRNCEICQAQMVNDPLEYHSHMVTEHHEELFLCRICDPNLVFESYEQLKQHVENYHKDYVLCSVCNITVLNEENLLKNHRREHRQFPFLCKSCDIPKNFSSEQTLNKHILNTHCPFRVCEICKLTLDNGSSFRHHMNSHRLRPHTCNFCFKMFSTKESLLKHESNTHQTDKPKVNAPVKYICLNCDRDFKTQAQLDKHTAKMVLGVCSKLPDERSRYCYICKSYQLNNKMKLKHLEECHQDVEKICEVCKYETKSLINFDNHLKSHVHGFDYFCTICGRDFRAKNLLKDHMAVHDPDVPLFACDICGKGLKHKMNLRRHMFLVHLNMKKYKCLMCNDPQYEYKTQALLNKHLHVKHGFEPKIKCPEKFCNAGFTYESELIVHLEQKQHGIESKYVGRIKAQEIYTCEEKNCGKSFNNKSNFLRHKNIHLSIKPYKCEFCQKTFGQRGQMETHRNTHTGEKPFSCDICRKAFGDYSTLHKHKKKVHRFIKFL